MFQHAWRRRHSDFASWPPRVTISLRRTARTGVRGAEPCSQHLGETLRTPGIDLRYDTGPHSFASVLDALYDSVRCARLPY